MFSGCCPVCSVTNCLPVELLRILINKMILFLFSHRLERFHTTFGLIAEAPISPVCASPIKSTQSTMSPKTDISSRKEDLPSAIDNERFSIENLIHPLHRFYSAESVIYHEIEPMDCMGIIRGQEQGGSGHILWWNIIPAGWCVIGKQR